MIKLTLKDGSVRECESGTPAAEVIKGIGMGLYKAACVVRINDKVCDIRTPITEDCTFEVMTFDTEDGKKAFWHTTSHIMAQAVKRLRPDVKLSIGPAIDNGFYYDFDTPTPFTAEDLEKFEAEMKKIVKENLELTRFELPPEEAIAKLKEMDEPYKVELCEEHAGKGENISFYTQGEFTDLCAGPHLASTGLIKAFKLTNCTGAYWRGDSKGKQMSRIYGISFPKASQLEEYLKMVEEARLRDHNKIGREQGYFTTVDYIGQGLPIMMPKGAKVLQLLQRWVEDIEEKDGCQITKTPFFAKSDLYKISGHWDHYRDGMFIMGDENETDGNSAYALRPMTCPFQYQVFLYKNRSYRELPIRLTETSTLFRNEDSGEMHGLIRVRQFTISEGHYIVTPSQLKEEFRRALNLAKYCLDTVGLLDDCTFRFSQWDPANPKNKYEGTAEQWEQSQAAMKEILDELGVEYTIGIDEAAFYGPKLDVQYKNVFGKEDTIVTIQIDMLLAKRFGMEYVDADNSKKNPIIIHRTSLGCYERTLAYLLEKYAGALPLWLMPEQVRMIPVTDRALEYAKELEKKLSDVNIRCSVDERSEGVGYKIRQGKMEKIPYLFIVGDKEVEEGTVSLNSRSKGDLGAMKADDAVMKIVAENASKSRD
ncbi:MAG: threonine--tRNA ligase [Oscillospiraceae bacterium]|nr:threonine--tRNA ligase [Oscillospiraceae bacterium]